jgi:LPS sulfotransferase NodH
MAPEATPARSYLVCATPRSGSTLLCEALRSTGVAGVPEEYFEALRQSGLPRRPQEYFKGVDDPSIADHLGEYARSDDAGPDPLWSREDYEPFFQSRLQMGTTDNGVFASKLMWGYFGDFVSLLREIPRFRELELPELLPAAFPDVSFVRVSRANRLRQAASLWKAVQTATWRKGNGHEGGAGGDPDEKRPQLRFHYKAIDHLLGQILFEEASWDAFFELCQVKPLVVNYERFVRNTEHTIKGILEQVGVEAPQGWSFEPEMRAQSDAINDDWVHRFGELRIGRQSWAAPPVEAPS